MLGSQHREKRLLPGEGLMKLSLLGDQATFSDLEFSYPLKLIIPTRHFFDGVAAVYVLSYGGGLVAGDRVKLDVDVEGGSTLVMLTQGSTKVFKTRPGRYLTASTSTVSGVTRQLLTVHIKPLSTLFLLPSPVTPFAQSNYSQRQAFHLADQTSSLILLDWYNSGRIGMAGQGEDWEFARYRSENEVWIEGLRVARDILLLQDPLSPTSSSYASRVSPYSCYATLLLFGPLTTTIRDYLRLSFSKITQYKQARPYDLLWSYSDLAKGRGGIARCAGASTESVKKWVVDVLQDGGVEGSLGQDLWRSFSMT